MMIFPPKHFHSDSGGRNESIHTAMLTKLSTPTVSYKLYVGAMKALCILKTKQNRRMYLNDASDTDDKENDIVSSTNNTPNNLCLTT